LFVSELYVATDPEGLERRAGTQMVWPLPYLEARPFMPGRPVDHDVVLLEPRGLLGLLDECIWRAEPLAGAAGGADAAMAAVYAERRDAPGLEHHVGARLLEPTAWDGFMAAGFALDCAERVVANAAGVSLPDGTSLADALGEVRSWLDSAEGKDGRVGKLHEIAIAHRLHREEKVIEGAAAKLAEADAGAHLDTEKDPVWTAVAAARDALLAAVEAVQHAVRPRHREREARHFEESEHGEHSDTEKWLPFWIAADDAAERARQAAADAGGDEAGAAETEWQAARLAALLLTPVPEED
jgi:hypothetical protein